VSAVTFLGHEITEKHPIVKDWAIGSPGRVNVDSMYTFAGPYRAVRQMSLASIYPWWKGTRTSRPSASRPCSPIRTDQPFDASGTYSPVSRPWPRTSGCISRRPTGTFDWTVQAGGTAPVLRSGGADQGGPEGILGRIRLQHPLFYDPPRAFDLTISGRGTAGS